MLTGLVWVTRKGRAVPKRSQHRASNSTHGGLIGVMLLFENCVQDIDAVLSQMLANSARWSRRASSWC
jgi:hypothetical protein